MELHVVKPWPTLGDCIQSPRTAKWLLGAHSSREARAFSPTTTRKQTLAVTRGSLKAESSPATPPTENTSKLTSGPSALWDLTQGTPMSYAQSLEMQRLSTAVVLKRKGIDVGSKELGKLVV